MKKSRSLFITLIMLGLVLLFFAPSQENSISGLIGEVEINEYEGKDLSSIDDFRENSILGPRFIDVQTYTLIVEGLVENSLEQNYTEVLESFESVKKVITLHCVEGWSVTILWEGFRLEDLLDQAQVNPETNTVIFTAYDGYTTSLPLSYIINNNIIIAYKMNNVTLPPERGFPFQLVAESKYGYKWIKWITKIELSNNSDYKGYWESRGYSNSADITGNQPNQPPPTNNFPTSPPATPPPTPTPTPNPTPVPSTTPPNTPESSPSESPTNEIGLPIEYTAITITTIAAIAVIAILLKRK
jgi:hypothetical protein